MPDRSGKSFGVRPLFKEQLLLLYGSINDVRNDGPVGMAQSRFQPFVIAFPLRGLILCKKAKGAVIPQNALSNRYAKIGIVPRGIANTETFSSHLHK